MGKLKDIAYTIAFSCLLITSVFLGVSYYFSHTKIQSLIMEVDSVRSENFALQSKIEVQERVSEAEGLALKNKEEELNNIRERSREILVLLESMKGDGKDEDTKRFLSTPIPDDVRRLLNN